MTPSVEHKLILLQERHEEVMALLGEVSVLANPQRLRQLAKEHAELTPVVQCFEQYQKVAADIMTATDLLTEKDAEIRSLAAAERYQGEEQLSALNAQLERLLLPSDPDDDSNIFVEIRAGTGGDEAALFCGVLFRMYARYIEQRGWELEPIHASPGEHGGYKVIITRIAGRGVYARLKFESGGHRVQRVPETESQGRIHTSACTVAVLPERDDIDQIDINEADLRIDSFRASGAGGQHVNKTDSAIRITHLPTNTVIECQDQRSQHKNRARAMGLLQAKLLDAERSKRNAERAHERKLLVGSGDRSQRIRTYNFPQGRVTDHRINLNVYQLDTIVAGALDLLIDPLITENQAQQLAAIQNL